jgi:ABC-type nitrate/sulfonate/bicarbonate transport system substrate-binding protein
MIVAVLVSASVMTFAAPVRPASAEPVTIRTIKQPIPYFASIYVAAAKGFDKQHNIKFDLVSLQSGAQNMPALFNGTLDIGTCTFDGNANFLEQGKQLISFYELLSRATTDLVLGNSSIKPGITPQSPLAQRMKSLKGMKFGITAPGAPSDTFLRATLRAGGLDPEKDVEIVRIGSFGGLVAATKSHQIDGYMLSPPLSLEAEKQGFGKVLIKLSQGQVPALDHFSFFSFCTTKDYAEKNPANVMAFAKTIQEANDWMHAHPDDAVKILQQTFPDVDAASWASGFHAILPALSKNGRFDKAGVDKAYSFYKEYGVIKTIPDEREGVTWTNKFVGNAVSERG